MQVIDVDKKKTPEIADWAADKEPGDRVCLYGTIKRNDDQTLSITVEEVGDDHEEDEKPVGGNEGAAGALPATATGAEMMDETAAD